MKMYIFLEDTEDYRPIYQAIKELGWWNEVELVEYHNCRGWARRFADEGLPISWIDEKSAGIFTSDNGKVVELPFNGSKNSVHDLKQFIQSLKILHDSAEKVIGLS